MTLQNIPANPFEPNAASGKIAVVSGASSGIGRVTVEQMRATGWTVYAVARRTERLEELSRQTGATAVPLDITDENAVKKAATDILKETGGVLHALVNISGGAIGIDSVQEGKSD